jgi:hypothetical protein
MHDSQQSAVSVFMGSSWGQDPVFGIFPYCSLNVGAAEALLAAKPRWGYHSNQLFYLSLILCSFCWSRRHDYSIGQSLSAWGAGPVPGRSPGSLLFISHAQLVRRMAGRERGGGPSHRPRAGHLQKPRALLMLQAYWATRLSTSRSLHKVRNWSVIKQCTNRLLCP